MNAYAFALERQKKREAYITGAPDEPTTVQRYGHENGAAIFIRTADEPTIVQTYVMKMPQGIFIGKI